MENAAGEEKCVILCGTALSHVCQGACRIGGVCQGACRIGGGRRCDPVIR